MMGSTNADERATILVDAVLSQDRIGSLGRGNCIPFLFAKLVKWMLT